MPHNIDQHLFDAIDSLATYGRLLNRQASPGGGEHEPGPMPGGLDAIKQQIEQLSGENLKAAKDTLARLRQEIQEAPIVDGEPQDPDTALEDKRTRAAIARARARDLRPKLPPEDDIVEQTTGPDLPQDPQDPQGAPDGEPPITPYRPGDPHPTAGTIRVKARSDEDPDITKRLKVHFLKIADGTYHAIVSASCNATGEFDPPTTIPIVVCDGAELVFDLTKDPVIMTEHLPNHPLEDELYEVPGCLRMALTGHGAS